MSKLKIRQTIEKYIDTSKENFKLLDYFLSIWKEGKEDINLIEAKKIFIYMIKEDKKAINHINDQLSFYRHSWVVGEYAADITRQLIEKYPKRNDLLIQLIPSLKRTEYAGGSHDIGKLLIKDKYQHAHEHLAYLIFLDNQCGVLANICQPHQPGEEKVLDLIKGNGDFLDIEKEKFCGEKSFPLTSDLIMLADMSCGIGCEDAYKRMTALKKKYGQNAPITIGLNDPKRGMKRVLGIEKKINLLLS